MLSGGKRTLAAALLCLSGLAVCITFLPNHEAWGPEPIWRTHGLMDAAAFRTGAQLLGKPGLYDVRAVEALQAPDAAGESNFRIVLRFPYYLFATKWLAAMPYSTAMGVWKLLLCLSCVAFVLVWPDRADAALAICWSSASMEAIQQGQDTLLFLLCLAAAIQLLRSSRDFLAGIVLSVCTIKPHLLVFLPLLFVRQRRFKFAAGFLTGVAAQLLISILVQGSSWPKEYLGQLLHPSLHSAYTFMPSVAGLLPGFGFQYRALACAAAAMLLLPVLLRICRRQTAWICLSCCVAAGLIVAPHAYIYDVALLIPLCLSVIRFRSLQTVALWLMSPVAAYPLALGRAFLEAAFIVFPVLLLLIRIGKRSLEEERELPSAPLQTGSVEPAARVSGSV